MLLKDINNRFENDENDEQDDVQPILAVDVGDDTGEGATAGAAKV